MILSYIWTGFVVISIIFSLINGNTAAVSSAALEGAANAVTLCLSMAGAMCLWSGVCQVMSDSGISGKLTKVLSPVLKRLYPKSSKHPETIDAIAANVSANLLGLGNAATPLGIKAVSLMKQRSGSEEATDEMCLLIVMNSASIELIPSTAAAIRAAAGSAAPFDILPAVWITSICSVCAGICAAKVLSRVWKDRAPSIDSGTISNI